MPRISKEEKARVRRRLLESAARHFAADGVGGANINQISVDAGYARGTVYNYFASKEELFTAVLEVGSDETVRRYRARAIASGVRAQLVAFVEEDVALVRDHEDFMKTFARELVAPSEATRPLVQAGVVPLVVEVTAILQAGQDAGEVRSDMPATQLATVFLGLMTMGYVQHWTTDGAWPTWEELPELVVRLFLEGAGR